MTLTELLQYVADETLDDRTVQVSGTPDSEWSDTVLVRYLNVGQQRLCEEAGALIDEANATAGQVTLQTGVAEYPLHASVLVVKKVTPADTLNCPLGHIIDANGSRPHWFDSMLGWDINLIMQCGPGRPRAFSTDTGTQRIKFYPTPSDTEDGLVLNLRVARLPLVRLTTAAMTASPEVAVKYHELMCDYAIGRALQRPTADNEQKAAGAVFLAQFEAFIGRARRARLRAEAARAVVHPCSMTAML